MGDVRWGGPGLVTVAADGPFVSISMIFGSALVLGSRPK